MAIASSARAAELAGLGGATFDLQHSHSSYGWQLEYLHPIGEHLALSLTYLNEGHLPDDHRDDHAAQLWARTSLLDHRLTIGAAAGPLLYYNTTRIENPGAPQNQHGFGGLLSVGASWQLADHWLVDLRTNWAVTAKSFDTITTLAGVAYRVEPEPPPEGEAVESAPSSLRNEVSALVGTSVLNGFEADHSVATTLEYRRTLCRYIEWTATWLHEANTHAYRQDGLVTQLWAASSVLDDRLILAAGAGPYVLLAHNDDTESRSGEKAVSAVLGLTGSYRLAAHFDVRISWDRIVTDYDQDADVILAGVGYRF